MSTPVRQTEPPEPVAQSRMAEYFFVCPEYGRFFDLVQHLVENTAEVLLLQGERGVGKTTLIYRLMAEAPRHWRICRVDANPMMRPDQLFSCLARCLAAPLEADQGTRVLLSAFSAARLQGQLPVVVVDDASELSIGALMALFRLQESGGGDMPPFAVILFAEPSIQATFSTQQFQAMGTSRIKRLEYPRLEAAHLEAYIDHYLRMEGMEQTLNLSDRQLAEIQQQAQGLPGRVNELVIQALKGGVKQASASRLGVLQSRLNGMPPLTAMAAGGLVLLLLITLFFQDSINAFFEAEPVAPGTVEVSAQGTVVQKPLVKALPLPAKPPEREEPDPEDPDAEREEQKQPQAEPDGPIDEPLYIPLAKPALKEPHPIQSEPARPEPTLPKVASAEKKSLPNSPEPEQAEAVEKAPPSPVVKKPIDKEPSRIVVEKKSGPAPEKPKKKALITDREWLLKQNPSAYTLQILGVSDEKAALKFIGQRKFKARVVYYRVLRNGKPWYSVLHGIYPNRQAAVSALAGLPSALRRIGAWPRSLESVQSELKRH